MMLAGLVEVACADFHLAQRGELFQRLSECFAIAFFKLRKAV
jgi:hypothetical protein